MRPERWREIEAVCQAAFERPAEKRAAFLEARCAGDAELLAEVSSLLAVEERAAEFLERPVVPPDPERVGPYRILRRLSAGGTSTVYVAQRGEAEDPVALKVLRGGLFLDDVQIRLFQREVQTLARLRHPSIARLYDAGRTEQGNPFFAMELVDGERLDTFARNRGLSLAARLRLFTAVCDAVDYAHQRGVVHRDLKPANVLVEPDGRPKVLDFGLARVTDSDLAARSTSLHAAGSVMGTLPYMSPEQARGRAEDIDRRADVYALGVVLYELLTGRRPFEFQGVLPHEALRTICEEPPRRPRALDPALRGDLETIVLKALEKDPQRRYSSAAALAEDVERFRLGQPILARPPSAIYLLRKLVGSHRPAAAALVAVLIAGFVFAAVLWDRNVELAGERDRALQAEDHASAEARRARAVLGFLRRVLSSADPDAAGESDVTLRAVLERAGAWLEEDLAAEPLTRAELHETFGRIQLALGRAERAAEHLSANLELLNEHLPALTGRLVEAHVLLGRALAASGQYQDAVTVNERGLALCRRLDGPAHVEAGLLLNLGGALAEQGLRDEAWARLEEALEQARAAGAEDGAPSGEALPLLAQLYWRRGEPGRAEELLRADLELALAGGAEECTRSADTRATLAQVLIEQQRFDEAAAHLERSLEVRARLLGADNELVVATRHNLATLLLELGRFHDARPVLLEVLEASRATLAPDDSELAVTLSSVGIVHAQLGLYEEAEGFLSEALQIQRDAGESRPDVLACHLGNLAVVLQALGEVEEAEGLVFEALDLRREYFGPDHPAVADSLSALGNLRYEQGQLDEAEALYRESLELRRAALAPDHPDLADGLNSLASVLQDRGALEQVEELYRRSLGICARVLGETHPTTALHRSNLGEVLVKRGRAAEALPLLEAALEVQAEALLPVHGKLAATRERLGAALLALGRPAEALPVFEEALAALRGLLPEGDPGLVSCLRGLGRALFESGQATPALAPLEEAQSILARERPASDDERLELSLLQARALAAAGRSQEAETVLVGRLEVLEAHAEPGDARLLETHRELAQLYEQAGRAEEAAFHRRAIE